MPYSCLPETGDSDPAVILESRIHVCKMRGWAQSAGRCSFISFPLDCILIRGVQPDARGPHAAHDGYECRPIQSGQFTENMRFLCVCAFHVAMYLMCGPEMPKGWTPLEMNLLISVLVKSCTAILEL